MATGRPVTLMALIMAPLHLFPLLQGSSQLSDLRAALKAAEEMIQTLDVIVWVADIRTLQVYCLSYGAERILSYPSNPQSMDQDFLRHHIHPDDRERVLQEIRRALLLVRPARLECAASPWMGRWCACATCVLADPRAIHGGLWAASSISRVRRSRIHSTR